MGVTAKEIAAAAEKLTITAEAVRRRFETVARQGAPWRLADETVG